MLDKWNKKEKPLFTGYRFGFGSGGGDTGESGSGISLSGGNVEYTNNGYKIHVFTSPGTLSCPASSNAAPVIKYVLIGGGGGCASDNSGGGGAGGVVTSIPGLMPATRTDLSMTPGQSVGVEIGAGGPVGDAGQPNNPPYGGHSGGNGFDTYYAGPAGNSVRALGGGAGGREGNTGPGQFPVPASSGGRGGSSGGARGGRPESAQVNPIDPTQGGTGSRAVGIDGTPGIAGGGGGGAGAGASDNIDGGIGIQLPAIIRDPSQPASVKGDPAPGAPSPGGWYFAGGGGARMHDLTTPVPKGGPRGMGGYGGGGQGNVHGDASIINTDGQANTGGGGGGGTSPQHPGASSGGSGIAFFYYPL